MARSLLSERDAEGRLRSACDLLRHVFGAAFVEEEMEEVPAAGGEAAGEAGGDMTEFIKLCGPRLWVHARWI